MNGDSGALSEFAATGRPCAEDARSRPVRRQGWSLLLFQWKTIREQKGASGACTVGMDPAEDWYTGGPEFCPRTAWKESKWWEGFRNIFRYAQRSLALTSFRV